VSSSLLRVRGRIDLVGDARGAGAPVLRDASDRAFYIEGEDHRAELLARIGEEVEVLGRLRGGAGRPPRLWIEAILSTSRRRSPRFPLGGGWR